MTYSTEPHFTRNSKTGKDGSVYTWNIPAIDTCPGASAICLEILPDGYARCYATREAYRMPFVQRCHGRNFDWSKSDEFVPWAIAAINRVRRPLPVVRWHSSGDFYDLEYIAKVHRIVRGTPRTQHYCYTRSWNVKDFLPALAALAQEPNFHMLFSFDRSMPVPPRFRGVGLCYLAVDDDDEPPCHVEVVFRDWPRYKQKTRRTRAAFRSPVCPHEDGVTKKITCSECRRCWTWRK